PFTHDTLLPVNPGEKDSMAIEVFNTDAVIQPGHRLRLTISSGDVPHLLATTPVALNSVGAVNTTYRGPGSQSFLTTTLAPLGPEPGNRASTRQNATKPKRRTKLQRCHAAATRRHHGRKARRHALHRCERLYGRKHSHRRH